MAETRVGRQPVNEAKTADECLRISRLQLILNTILGGNSDLSHPIDQPNQKERNNVVGRIWSKRLQSRRTHIATSMRRHQPEEDAIIFGGRAEAVNGLWSDAMPLFEVHPGLAQ